MRITALISFGFTTLVTAYIIPVPTAFDGNDEPSTMLPRRSASQQAVDQLIKMAPTVGCADAKAESKSECAEAVDIIQPLLNGLYRYGITTAAEQAAVVSWMTYESDDFHYNKNHYPGTPGQGTSCMMSPTYVSQYAASVPELASQTSGKSPADVLELINSKGDYTYAAASWFYQTQCSTQIKAGVKTGTQDGWSDFITQCVHTTMVDERVTKWKAAMTALGLN